MTTFPLELERWTIRTVYAALVHRLAFYPQSNTLRVEYITLIGNWRECEMPHCLPSFKPKKKKARR
jgi:hypothetical protein